MKKIWVIIINIFIMIAMLTFVVLYSTFDNKILTQRQIEHFENTTITMKHVTENYLVGEQRICDVWANYISSKNMTIEQAISFIRISHVQTNASAHIVFRDTLMGLSTKARQNTLDTHNVDYSVSYQRLELLNDISWINEIGKSINVSRAYTNPVNGEQSIAFCNNITLTDTETGSTKDAILLRILPIAELKEKWVFPKEEFESAELSMIDKDGNYIIKGHSFKNSNLFEFYRSYNIVDSNTAQELFNKITSSTGSVTMLNSKKEPCILSYTPIASAEGWALLSFIEMNDLNVKNENWLLIGFVSIGLLILFVFDLSVMQYFNKKLKAAAKEAAFANKAKTDFLSTMSHDIRTPMNAIIGLTTISKKNIDDKQLVKENLRKIETASNHLLTLINDILDISKVESGKLNFSPQSFSIVDTVENLVNLSLPMIKDKNINFNFYIDNIEKENIYADQLRLNQIYINILSNAIKYTEAGGSIKVDIHGEISEKPNHIRLIYIVSDTGIGMSEEFMKKMYEPFSRQTDSRINVIQGTGLGLTITRQMVELMGGEINCQSEVGKGTTFTVTLDLPIAEKQREDLILNDINALIIDSDDVFLKTTSNTLSSLGVTSEKSKNAQDALDMIKHNHVLNKDYKVVILDLEMINSSTSDTIKQIRNELEKSSSIFMISTYDWTDIEDLAKETGASGFINKPIFRSTLYDKINELLGTPKGSTEIENDYSHLQGMHILVAEDNEINWEIISTLLDMYGIKTERAENGLICLEKVKAAKEGDYDLIFMDIQMPEMNGLDVTKNIRKLNDHWASSIPIIAMTADAFSENVTECLNAGMNGHIAKPIDINLVIKEVSRIKEEKKK